ncbi:hypothetical protein ACHQM5_013459 [Ranunculus cassubicifolius]
MGDLEGLGLQPSGFLIDDPLCSTPSISPLLSNPSPASISNDCWQRAEKNVLEIIRLVQPTVVSEQTRKGIIEFLQELISCNLRIEIFPFGSVPLKTYLPDGDIDLTALSLDSLANEVRAVLERVENSKDSGFVVKDVQYINDGDYDNHMYSLACARSCSDGGPYLHFAPAHSSEFHQNPQFPYDMYQGLPHMPYAANGFSHMNGVYQGPHYYHHVPPGYGVDDATSRHRVHRGTGTYLPNLHNGGASYRERYSSGKRRSGPPLPHNNNQPARSLRESNLAGKHVAPHERLPQRNPSQAKQPLPTAPPGFGLSLPNGNGFTSVLEKVEFGSLGQFPLSSTKDSKNQQVISNNKQQHTKVGTTSCSSKSKPVSGPNVEGSKRKEFHLKNEAEFPPLGVPVAVAVAAAGQSSR